MSAEYTPTTEQVRAAWATDSWDNQHPDDLAEFDRWLAEHDREVAATAVKAERRRLRLEGDPIPEGVERGVRVRVASATKTAVGAVQQVSPDRLSLWIIPEPLDSDNVFWFAYGTEVQILDAVEIRNGEHQ